PCTSVRVTGCALRSSSWADGATTSELRCWPRGQWRVASVRQPVRRHVQESRAVRRAVAAAVDHEPWLPAGFVWWTIGRLLAAAMLVGAAWFVYDCASSDRFRVRSIHVDGNALLSQAEIETA